MSRLEIAHSWEQDVDLGSGADMFGFSLVPGYWVPSWVDSSGPGFARFVLRDLPPLGSSFGSCCQLQGTLGPQKDKYLDKIWEECLSRAASLVLLHRKGYLPSGGDGSGSGPGCGGGSLMSVMQELAEHNLPWGIWWLALASSQSARIICLCQGST